MQERTTEPSRHPHRHPPHRPRSGPGFSSRRHTKHGCARHAASRRISPNGAGFPTSGGGGYVVDDNDDPTGASSCAHATQPRGFTAGTLPPPPRSRISHDSHDVFVDGSLRRRGYRRRRRRRRTVVVVVARLCSGTACDDDDGGGSGGGSGVGGRRREKRYVLHRGRWGW